MRKRSLFGEIALRSSSHPENLATEALLFILREYPSAWAALRLFVELAGVSLPEKVAFSSQVAGDDQSIPDLVASDAEGNEVLIIEAKFWAGLTVNQPAAYLRRLPSDKPGLLAVLAPETRTESLWGKLVRAAAADELIIRDVRTVAPGFRCGAISDAHILALISWPAMLTVLLRDAEVRSDADLQGDIHQLAGLCARVDSDAFLPLRNDELSPATGRRVKQFADLVDGVVAELVSSHNASTEGLTTGGSQSVYGRYFHLADLAFFFAYWPDYWARHAETPFWLRVTEGDWKDTPRIPELLKQLFAGDPGAVFVFGTRAHVPIWPPIGVEREEVVDSIIQQILVAARACAPADEQE